MKRVELTEFELGALYAVIGTAGLNKLPDSLRRKLRTQFKELEMRDTPSPLDYEAPSLATENDNG